MMINNFFFLELFKSIIFSRARLFIILISIFIGALSCSAFLNIYFDIDTKLSRELKAYGANVMIAPASENENSSEDEMISNEDFEEIKKALNPRAISPFLFGFFNLGSTSAVVLGTDLRNLKLTKPFIEVREGSFGLNDFSDDAAFVGVDLAKELETKIGNEVQIYNSENGKSMKLKVRGIIANGDELDSLLIAPLEAVQKLSGDAKINYATAIVLGSFDEVKTLAAKLSTSRILIKPISSVSLSESAVLGKIKALMFLIILVILIIVSASVNTTLGSIIFSRKNEIALRLALGAKISKIFKLYLGECFVVSLLAAVVGSLCGIFLADLFGFLIFNASIDLRFKAIALSIFISLFFAMIATITPIKRALKINICESLKNE